VSIFGEVVNPGRGQGSGRSEEAQERHVARLIKMGSVAVALLIAAFIFFNYVASITRIGAGYVGVEVVLSGSQRGPSEIPIRTGWVFYSPLRSEIIEFPTFVQTVKWTHDLNEGRAANEEMSFNSKEGMEIYADVSMPSSRAECRTSM
jgi:hypothetical protein